MIDLCLTNSLSTTVDSGVIHLSISDHSMVYIIRKAHYVQTGTRNIETRSMKTFNRDSFLSELGQQLYISIYEIVIKFYVSYDSFKYYYCLYVHMVF